MAEKNRVIWNYRTQPQGEEPPEYVKRNLEARVNKVDIRLVYGSDLKLRGKRTQRHDRPEELEGPKGN